MKGYKGGLNSWCRKCVGKYHSEFRSKKFVNGRNLHDHYALTRLLKPFGMSVEMYDTILQSQGGLCAICRNPEKQSGKRRLSIEHCHATGKFRGLVCNSCNSILGNAKDSILVLESAIRYLQGHSK